MKIPARSSSRSKTTFTFEFSVRPHLSFPQFSSRTPLYPASTAQTLTTTPERNGRKTLTTVQGLPKKFDQKKILKVIKKKFACNGTIVSDLEMGEVVQLQGDQRKDVQDFLTDKKEGLGLDAKTIKVSFSFCWVHVRPCVLMKGIGPRFLGLFELDECTWGCSGYGPSVLHSWVMRGRQVRGGHQVSLWTWYAQSQDCGTLRYSVDGGIV